MSDEPNLDIAVADGKYRFVQEQTDSGSASPIRAFRHGEEWEAANRTLEEMRFSNWLWFLMMDAQETALSLRRANARLTALGQAVEPSPVRLPPVAGPMAAPGKAPPYAPGAAS